MAGPSGGCRRRRPCRGASRGPLVGSGHAFPLRFRYDAAGAGSRPAVTRPADARPAVRPPAVARPAVTRPTVPPSRPGALVAPFSAPYGRGRRRAEYSAAPDRTGGRTDGKEAGVLDADIVVVGAGAAGLSLAHRLPARASLRAVSSVVLVDPPPGPLRPPRRTWCFWEAGPGRFDPATTASWEWLRVHGEGRGGPLGGAHRRLCRRTPRLRRAADGGPGGRGEAARRRVAPGVSGDPSGPGGRGTARVAGGLPAVHRRWLPRPSHGPHSRPGPSSSPGTWSARICRWL